MSRLIDLVAVFPRLLEGSGYRRTSDPSVDYNCLAWVFSDETRRWDVAAYGAFWPPGIPRQWTRNNLMRIFRERGFAPCADASLEPGFEKIAVYENKGRPEHFARQLPDGRWTSKLRDWDDITHDLYGVAGDVYGQPTIFLRRPMPS